MLKGGLHDKSDITQLIKTSPKKGNGKTDAEALKLWTPDAKSQLNGKDTDAGKD